MSLVQKIFSSDTICELHTKPKWILKLWIFEKNCPPAGHTYGVAELRAATLYNSSITLHLPARDTAGADPVYSNLQQGFCFLEHHRLARETVLMLLRHLLQSDLIYKKRPSIMISPVFIFGQRAFLILPPSLVCDC